MYPQRVLQVQGKREVFYQEVLFLKHTRDTIIMARSTSFDFFFFFPSLWMVVRSGLTRLENHPVALLEAEDVDVDSLEVSLPSARAFQCSLLSCAGTGWRNKHLCLCTRRWRIRRWPLRQQERWLWWIKRLLRQQVSPPGGICSPLSVWVANCMLGLLITLQHRCEALRGGCSI